MRTVLFYRTPSGGSPVEEFLDKLTEKQVEKILWVLKLIKEMDRIPSIYFKKLINTDEIWEVRVSISGNIFRILGFCAENTFLILTNGFLKKSQTTPRSEIALAQDRKREYLKGKKRYG